MKKIICLFLCFFLMCGVVSAEEIGEKQDNDKGFNGAVILTNDIPKLYITGNLSNMVDKEDERIVSIEYTSKTKNFTSYATIKLQGNSSLKYPKKNYNLRLYKDENCENKNKVDLKWGKYERYTLKANWIDRTHSRNIVSSRIMGDINKKYGYFNNTPNNGLIDGFAIEVYINKEFHGLYTINLYKKYMYDEEDKEHTLVSTSHNVFLNPEIKKEDNRWTHFEVEVGESDEDTLNNLNRLLTFINTSTDKEFRDEIENYFNLDSLINYYCFVRFADLYDNLSNNLYLLTYDGKIWYTVFYDLDTSFGVTWKGAPEEEYMSNFYIKRMPLWNKLEKTFPDEIAERWKELRKDIFTKEYVMNKFYEFHSSIPVTSLQKEATKWKDAPSYLLGDIINYLDTMLPKLDKSIADLKVLDTENKNDKKDNEICINPKDNKVITLVITIILLIIAITIMIVLISKRKNKTS